MGWADCGRDERGRRIGYAFAARCDQPGCYRRIDRGLSFVCGGMHGGAGKGCGGYFCSAHLDGDAICRACRRRSRREDACS